MHTVSISESSSAEITREAAPILISGGVVLFPTDTLYGLGADAFSNVAVDKIYAIKGRNEGKPIHAIVTDLDMANQYGVVTDMTRTLVERLPKGQVTFIVRKREVDTGICRSIETFGFRVPDNELCIELVRAFGKPITATSANRAGEKPERTVGNILAQLGENARGIDLAIDAGELPPRKASSVIDLSHEGNPVILREEAVSAAEIWEAIRSLA